MKRSDKLVKKTGIEKNFGDSVAVIREWKDTAGKNQKIDIFYGGKDGGDSEGHGHWVAENIDGLYQVTLDRQPDNVDGGRHLIESSHRSDAYNNEARLDRIRAKEAVISELKYIDSSGPSLGNKVKELRNKLYACGSCGHDDNERLKKSLII